MPRALPLVALALSLSPALALGAESSIRCDGGLVGVGDTKVDLLGKCGEPALRDPRPVVVGAVLVQGSPPAVAGSAASTIVEQWTYDFGPGRFIHLVTLDAGRVVAIERGGYGYGPARLRDARAGTSPRCESSALSVGLTKLDLLARCGEPTTRDTRREQRALAAGDGAVIVTVELETWAYDLGQNRFVQLVTLEDGKVIAVESGGYGYAR